MSLEITTPWAQYFGKDGYPLDNGMIYIGAQGANPETSQIAVYWDSAGTQPAAQPIRTVAGYPARNGNIGQLFILVNAYSETVKTKDGVLVGSILDKTGPSGSSQVFNSTVTMKAATNLQAGNIVRTAGYYALADGGEASYQIMTAAAFGGTPDEIGDFAITDTSHGSLVAKIMLDRQTVVWAEQFGCIRQPTFLECSARWQEAFYRAMDLSGPGFYDGKNVTFCCYAPILVKNQLVMQNRDGSEGQRVFVFQYGSIFATTGGGLQADVLATSQAMVKVRCNNSTVWFGLLDCSRLCSCLELDKVGQTNIYHPVGRHFTRFGMGIFANAGGDPKIFDPDMRQWQQADAEWDTDSNFTADCIVVGLTDGQLYGGTSGWGARCIRLLGSTPTSGAIENRTTYAGRSSEGCSDFFFHGHHVFQGRGPGTVGSPHPSRMDNLDTGGPISIECWNEGRPAFFLNCDIDASSIRVYKYGIQIIGGSYIVNGGNATINGRVVVIDPRIRIYSDGSSNPRAATVAMEFGASVGFFPFEGNVFTGDYSQINLDGRQESSTYLGVVNYRGLWSAASGAFPTGTIAAGDFWLVSGEVSSTGNVVDGINFLPGDLLYALTAAPGTSYAPNWYKSIPLGATHQRVDNMALTVRQGDYRILPLADAGRPVFTVLRGANIIDEYWYIGTAFAKRVWDGLLYTISAASIYLAGAVYTDQPAPTAKAAGSTFTRQEMLTCILNYTGAVGTLTTPTATSFDNLPMPNNTRFDFWIQNTGAGTCTLTAAAGVTINGTATIGVGAIAMFSLRRVNLGTYIIYRMS